jgi:hypothetical protein
LRNESFFSAPQLKRDPLDGPMKHRAISQDDALSLLDELRAMASLEPGPDPKRLARAKEIRFLLQGQDWASLWMRDKLDEAYRHLEILLSARRWRDLLSVDGLRGDIKGICSRIAKSLSARARAV